jgi:8-oxo-dGTP diphosphatase
MAKRWIHVAVGALQAGDGRILVSKRPDGAHQGGLWEFPGGKLEAGESVSDALARELYEELGVRLRHSQPLIRLRHDYGDRRVLLDVHRVLAFTGEAQGCEGQPLRWLHPAAMQAAEFPAADRPIINALRLPERLLITGAGADCREVFLARLRQALGSGIRLLQLRAPELSMPRFLALADAVVELCAEQGVTVILNPPRGSWQALPAGVGLHLNRWRLLAMRQRPLGRERWVGASCHTLEELLKAQQLGLDYALLSPVLPTASHPETPPLGWQRFSAWVDGVSLPVFALGGLGEAHVEQAQRAGGQGVAAISAWWPG